MEKISKEPLGKKLVTYDFKGNAYSSSAYLIPSCKIGPFQLNQCEVTEESLDFHQNTSLWNIKKKGSPKYHGRIGWKFFENQCVLFDFLSSAIYMGENIEALIKDGLFCKNEFHSVPLEIKHGILCAEVQTDLGIHKLAFDTGASFCILDKKIVPGEKIKRSDGGNTYFSGEYLLINGCDFLDWDFAAIEFYDQFDIDGLIGKDFFMEYPICFDFKNNMAYIQKPKGVLGTQWKRAKFYITQFLTKHSSEFSNMEEL